MSENTEIKTNTNENEYQRKNLWVRFAYYTVSAVVLVIAMMYALQTSRIAVQRPPEVQVAEYKAAVAMYNAQTADANAKIAEANAKQHGSNLRITPAPALNPSGKDLIIEEGENHE